MSINLDKKLSLVKDKTIALVLDGFINGLGIVRSLKVDPTIYTVVICKKGAALGVSNKVDLVFNYASNDEFLSHLKAINNAAKLVIPYYCNDENLKTIFKEAQHLENFKLFPFDMDILTKEKQLELCKEIGITIPSTDFINNEADFLSMFQEGTSYIIRPSFRRKNEALFKAKISRDKQTLWIFINKCLLLDIPAVISEYIPGDDTTLYTLGGYAHKGNLVCPFTGRKISQRPRYNGVASIAEAIECLEIETIGKAFLKTISFTGIFQIEFKYNTQNNTYYFIEFNPRNWSWGYVATNQGRNLPLHKFYVETNSNKDASQNTGKAPLGFTSYFWSEGILYNLVIDRWFGVIPIAFKHLLSRKLTYAIYHKNDPKPFFRYLRNTLSFGLRLRKELR